MRTEKKGYEIAIGRSKNRYGCRNGDGDRDMSAITKTEMKGFKNGSVIFLNSTGVAYTGIF